MATVTAFIRTSKTDRNKKVFVRFRLSDGRTNQGGIQIFHKSEILIKPTQWDEKQQKLKARSLIDEHLRKEIDSSVSERKNMIKVIFLKYGRTLTSEILELEIDKTIHPEKHIIAKKNYFELFEIFLTKHPLSDVRRKNYRVVLRSLQRFELYTKMYIKSKRSFQLDIDTINPDILQSFDVFLRNEHEYFSKYPDLYNSFPEKRANEPRGSNTISGIYTKLRTFTNWCIRNGFTSNNPFLNYTSLSEVYGTPYYLTVKEKNDLFNHDFSDNKPLEKQRDIFVFQCSIGCRVGDLYKFRKKNIMGEFIEYIASKTKDEKPETIRVPLNENAKEIINKYSSLPDDQLLPFISQQKYNQAIKVCLTKVNITREVTILNPLTRQSEIRAINELASSHLARRTFIGNLHKNTKDPNIIGKLTGHAVNSKAFARYRDIDDDMKKDLVKLLD